MLAERVMCLCGHEFDGDVVTGPLITPHCVCPSCGKENVVRGTEHIDVHNGNQRFYGEQQFSLVSGCHPRETKLYKRIMGPRFEHLIGDDGTVRFTTQKQQAEFVEHFRRQRQRNAADPGMFHRRGPRPEDIR